jgi:hypothetical protein
LPNTNNRNPKLRSSLFVLGNSTSKINYFF